MIPRPLQAFAFTVLVLLLIADVGGQFVIPGHSASPIVSGGILTIIGGAFAASRGPKPTRPPPDPPTDELAVPEDPPPEPPTGRHHRAGSL